MHQIAPNVDHVRRVTRREKDGQWFKEITEVTIAPMFGPEFHHYDQRYGISPRQHVENKLELATLPVEAKLDFTAPDPTPGYHWGHPMDSLAASNLFHALFEVDLKKIQHLEYALGRYLGDTQEFLAATRNFYRSTRSQRNQRSQLNLYPDYPNYMELFGTSPVP